MNEVQVHDTRGTVAMLFLLPLAILATLAVLYAGIIAYNLNTTGAHAAPVSQHATSHNAPVVTYYLAHCDSASGHYMVVTTDSERTASDEMRLGFWPISESYYKQLAPTLPACVPGPMDNVTH